MLNLYHGRYSICCMHLQVNLLKTKFGFDDAFNYKKETDLEAALKRSVLLPRLFQTRQKLMPL